MTSNQYNVAKMMECQSYNYDMLYKTPSCWYICLLCIADFEEASCHKLNDHIGEAYIPRNLRRFLGAEHGHHQKTKTLSPAARKEMNAVNNLTELEKVFSLVKPDKTTALTDTHITA